MWILAVFGGVAGLMGVTLNVSIRRYRTELEQFYSTPIDYESPPAFAYTLLQTVGLGVAFSGMLYFALSADLIAPISDWLPATNRLVIFGSTVLGLVLGAAYLPLIQKQEIAPMLSVGQWASQLDGSLFVTAFVVLLFGSDPLSAVVFGVAYFGSRLAVLGSIRANERTDQNRA
jgi:hypothetical protein